MYTVPELILVSDFQIDRIAGITWIRRRHWFTFRRRALPWTDTETSELPLGLYKKERWGETIYDYK